MAPDWDEGNTQMWVGKPAPSEISDKVEKARVVLGDTIVDMMTMQIEIDRLRAWLSYIAGNFRNGRECAEEALRGDPPPEGFGNDR